MKIFLFILVVFTCLTSHHTLSQDTINKSPEYGFYVKNGTNKKLIKGLDCYSFDELSVTFPLTPEMQGYDYIGILVYHDDDRGWSQGFCEIVYPGDVFRAKFQGQKEGEVILFKKGHQKHALNNGEMTRGSLNYSYSSRLEGHIMKYKVYGYSITGYSNGSSIYSDRFYLYESDIIPMTNRGKKKAFLAFAEERIVDLSQPCTE